MNARKLIERKLSRLDGVTAVVNYATGRARVTAPAGTASEALIGAAKECGDLLAQHFPAHEAGGPMFQRFHLL